MTGQEPPDSGQRSQPDDWEVHHVHQIASAEQGSNIHQAGRDLSILNVFYSDRHTRSLLAGPHPLAEGMTEIRSPYRGLGAFRTGDARFFFGREPAIDRVWQMISSSAGDGGPVVVSGASGSGKSSLLQAGVLPRIRNSGLSGIPEAARWPCLLMRPTADPFAELAHGLNQLQPGFNPELSAQLAEQPDLFASAVRHLVSEPPNRPTGDRLITGESSQRLLLIVDQFEQIFTLCRDEAVRERFIAALDIAARKPMTHGTPPAVVVVLAVRADFEARCAEYEALAQPTQDRFLLAGMTERQLEMAVTEPPKRLGATVDRDLVARLLIEVARGPAVGGADRGEPGAGVLPLLSYALDEAWRQQEGAQEGTRVLTLTDYERTGGLESAVARSAQTAYDRLNADQQSVTKALFLRLTRTTFEGVDTSSPAARAELLAMGSSVEPVLDAFAEERLLTLSSEMVEISHEALLSAWPKLREWLDESRTQRGVLERIHSMASVWESREERSYLYEGLQLVAAVQAVEALGDDLMGPLDRKFLAASHKADRRRQTVRRTVFGTLVSLTVCLALLMAFTVQARNSAVEQRNAAVSARLVNKSEGALDTDPTGGRLDSLAAHAIAPTSVTTRYGLINASANRLLAVIPTDDIWITAVALNDDGSTLAFGGFGTRGDGGTIGVADVRSHKITRRRQSATPSSVVFDSTGRVRSSAGESTDAVAVSGDGTTRAARQKDGSVVLTEKATGTRVGSIDAFGGSGSPLALNHDASVAVLVKDDSLLSTDSEQQIRLVDTSTGQILDTLTSPGRGRIHCVTFSRNGRRVAVGTEAPAGSGGGDGGHFNVWDLSPGRATASAAVSVPTSVRGNFPLWLGDGGRIVATAAKSGVVLVRPAEGTRQTLSLQGGALQDLAFSSDGTRLAVLASGSDRSQEHAYVWDLRHATAKLSQDIDLPGFQPHGITLSDDGRVLVVGGNQLVRHGREAVPRMTARFWHLGPSAFQPTGPALTGSNGFASIEALTANGERAVVATQEGAQGTGILSFWDVARGKRTGSPQDTGSTVRALAISPSGKLVASADAKGQIRLWNPSRGIETEGAPLEAATTINEMRFSSDGRTLATGDGSGRVQLWDVATRLRIGRPFAVVGGPVVAKSMVFTDDDTRLAAAAATGQVVVIDVGFLRDAQADLCRQVGSLMSARWWAANVPEIDAVTASRACA
ncbi:WD40 repeat domain-containing protein [Streptomyces microflavus]|uniref:WD40 repeat domain-containing protein n=1 Tax=Streptomyces microflavus TaxID=1919 RepID=UPI003452D5D0